MREALSQWFIFPRNDPGMIGRLVSKKGMYELALKLGVPTPVTLFPECLDDVKASCPRSPFR